MQLHKISITKTKLKSISEDEQIFFVQITNFLNDINILQKLVVFSNKEVEDDTVRKAQNSQSFFILSILAGKLWEGWQLLQKNSKLLRTYEPLLDSIGKESLKNLRKYFSKDNLINHVRSKFAFHYDSDEIKNEIQETSEDTVFELFLSENQGNCLYYMSNVLVSSAILSSIDKSDALKALDRFFFEILEETKMFHSFYNSCLVSIAEKHLEKKYENVEIPEPPDIREVWLPYFVKK